MKTGFGATETTNTCVGIVELNMPSLIQLWTHAEGGLEETGQQRGKSNRNNTNKNSINSNTDRNRKKREK